MCCYYFPPPVVSYPEVGIKQDLYKIKAFIVEFSVLLGDVCLISNQFNLKKFEHYHGNKFLMGISQKVNRIQKDLKIESALKITIYIQSKERS